MAFVMDVREFQALLVGCFSIQELELLIQSILIPEEWFPMAHARLPELTAQEIPIEINHDTGNDEVNEADELEKFMLGGVNAGFETDELLSDSFTAEEKQVVNEMERMALDKWKGEASELPTWNPSKTEIQSGEGELPAKKPRKEHRCDTCGKTFTRPNYLITLEHMHTGEKPYECTRCDKKFSDKSALNRHLKAHEKRALQRTFTCGTCGETFHNCAPYNAYIRTAHQQPVAATRKRTAQKTTDAPSTKRPKRSDQTTNLDPASEENITQTYWQHWPQIRTRFSRHNRLQD
ncbi:unnamed protein product [Porites evermanni]|uniref:C2H2-type domain-containing protein n=1 Tax=Porites evermanni TaxID=104178 RepID=A0ABN8S1A3_9CNID|nr:unnamed protein product [Porites evermanni]